MKYKFLALGAALAGFLSLTGCSTVNTVENANKVGMRQMVADKRITTDPELSRAARVVGVNITNGEFLKVQVEVVNLTMSVQRFNYQFEWFDLNGMQVTSPGAGYVTRQIEGQETLYLTGVAPTAACRDFRLKLLGNVR